MVTAEKARHNLLRPEAMEAMFVLWRVTQKEIYREWAWEMFLAFERNCKVRHGSMSGIPVCVWTMRLLQHFRWPTVFH